jgi:hypothetical protein
VTSFLLSADINEGGKFELTAPISVKEKKKKERSINIIISNSWETSLKN